MSGIEEGMEEYDELLRMATAYGDRRSQGGSEGAQEDAPTTGSTVGAYSVATAGAGAGQSEENNSEQNLPVGPAMAAPTPLRRSVGGGQTRAGDVDIEALRRSMGTAPSSTDVDIDTFAYELEDHWRSMKKDAVDRFLEAKRKAALHEKNMVDAERRHGLERLTAKQQEVDTLQEALLQQTNRTNTTYTYLDSSCLLLARRADLVKAWTSMGFCWHTWRTYTTFEKRLKYRNRLAAQNYGKTLLRHAVQSWRAQVREWVAQRTADEHAAALAQLEHDLTRRFSDTIAGLRNSLAAANAQIAMEEARREELERNMKQAFMRGVCALNIEAMAVMKKGTGIQVPSAENQDSNVPSGNEDGDGATGGAPAVEEYDDTTRFMDVSGAPPQASASASGPQPTDSGTYSFGGAYRPGAQATSASYSASVPTPRDVSAYPRPIATAMRPRGGPFRPPGSSN